MHRFFVPPEALDGDTAVLPKDASRQISRVLRARPGDTVLVLDDTGMEYVVELTTVDSEKTTGLIISRSQGRGEPRVNLSLLQSVLKSDKFEFVLQKGTELGVSTFVPVYSERSVPRQSGSGGVESRYTRWRKIIVEAAEQSHRSRLPLLMPPMTFEDACDTACGLCLVPWESEDTTAIKTAITQWKAASQPVRSATIFIGPEGGFTSEEVNYARRTGIVSVSLGSRILRTETASIAAVTMTLYELGDLGS